MKLAFNFTLAISLVFLFHCKTFSQTCEECKQRSIIVYDLNVNVPQPVGPDSVLVKKYAEWWNLFYIAGGVRNYIWKDATTDCFIKLCSAFYTETDSINSKIKFGTTSPNLPPSGSVGGNTDYIISGTVSGVEGSYTLQLYLETAKSRESVKGVTINFSSGFDPFQVGENAANNFGPLYDQVMEFEKKKRDEGEPIAIRPKVKAVPQKSVLEKNESTNVEFTVTDCDEKPLKDRTIEISADNGIFDKETITTDESGKATAKYTAGGESGVANIKGILVYRMPTEPSAVSTSDGGDAIIEIEKQKYWKVLARYYWQRTSEDETILQTEGFSSISKSSSTEDHQVSFTAFVNMASALPGTFYRQSVISLKAYGGTHFRSMYDRRDLSKDSYSFNKSDQNCSGTLDTKSDKADIWVDFGAREVEVLFKIPANVTGTGSERIDEKILDQETHESFQTDCYENESTGHDFHAKYDSDTTYNYVDNIENEILKENTVTSIIKYFKTQDGVSVFGYDEDQTVTTKGQYENTLVKYKTEFYGEIITDQATSVEDNKLFTQEFCLSQNYPNPFNPTTLIAYNIAKPSYVKISITNVLGEVVSVIDEGSKNSGSHLVRFNASNLASGIYFYSLVAQTENGGNIFHDVKKMLFLK